MSIKKPPLFVWLIIGPILAGLLLGYNGGRIFDLIVGAFIISWIVRDSLDARKYRRDKVSLK